MSENEQGDVRIEIEPFGPGPRNRKGITISVSQVALVAEETVHLKLDRRQIAVLPAIPTRRHWWS